MFFSLLRTSIGILVDKTHGGIGLGPKVSIILILAIEEHLIFGQMI
jgi:hypothetical protein